MSRLQVKISNLSKELIVALTGFDESDENFQLCFDYASSNFKYHKFLDPDSHKINRTIKGLCEKFRVCGQQSKCDTLKKLVSDFLQIPAFENREYGETGTHWAVLSLLLSLSESPTNVKYKPVPKKTTEVVEDDFDWTAYLLEGEEIFTQSHDLSSTDDEEEKDFSDEENYLDKVKLQKRKASGVQFEKDSVSLKADGNVSRPQFSVNASLSDNRGLLYNAQQLESISAEWLKKNTMSSYWNGRTGARVESSDHPSSAFNTIWSEHCDRVSVLGGESYDRTLVTEYQIIREILWVLSGVNDSFVFVISNNRCGVNENIKLSHLTQTAIVSVLEAVCKYANIVFRLQEFIDCVTQNNESSIQTNAAEGAGELTSQTYEAFGACLSRYLTDFRQTLVIFEKQVIKDHDKPATISVLLHNLKPFFSELDLLEHVLTNGVEASGHMMSSPGKASLLLAEIYDTLCTCDTMGEYGANHVSLLFPLWILTCKPYLDIIDNWISNGYLRDPRKEFIIQRNHTVNCLDDTFWTTGFTLYTGCEKENQSNVAGAGDDPMSQLQHAPSFLFPVLHRIILAGKSMEMLENMGKKAKFVEKDDRTFKRKTLYESFIASMEEFLGTSTDIIDEGIVTSPEKHPPIRRKDKDEVKNKHLQVNEIKDSLLALNFSQMFQKLPEREEVTSDTDFHKKLEALRVSGVTPFQLILEKCLYPHINVRYQVVCSGLLDIMKTDFNLMQCFNSFKKFYLMEAGDTMYDFYTEIFEKLRHKESWQDLSYLTMLLQEALQVHYPNDIDRLTVELTPRDAGVRDRSPITALAGLGLHYHLPWPLTLVFSGQYMETYNQVFSFLLQIKRAKYCLDQLRFSDLEKQDIVQESQVPGQTALVSSAFEDSIFGTGSSKSSGAPVSLAEVYHTMHIIRMKLLTFVNSLHHYIMTRILHSTGLEFQAEIQQASDLDQVIRTHQKYLKLLHTRCLQHKDVKMIRDLVTNVLNLAVKFQQMWDEGIHNLRWSDVINIESEFSNFITFLTSILTKAIKRGSFPHLESLAFALVTFTNQKKS